MNQIRLKAAMSISFADRSLVPPVACEPSEKWISEEAFYNV